MVSQTSQAAPGSNGFEGGDVPKTGKVKVTNAAKGHQDKESSKAEEPLCHQLCASRCAKEGVLLMLNVNIIRVTPSRMDALLNFSNHPDNEIWL